MAGKRNNYGVNNATDCYRTFNGSRFDAWISFPSNDLIAAYREKGVRCRRLGVELFVHVDDLDLAAAIDKKFK